MSAIRAAAAYLRQNLHWKEFQAAIAVGKKLDSRPPPPKHRDHSRWVDICLHNSLCYYADRSVQRERQAADAKKQAALRAVTNAQAAIGPYSR